MSAIDEVIESKKGQAGKVRQNLQLEPGVPAMPSVNGISRLHIGACLEDVEDFLDDVERFALPEMTSSQVATLLSFEEALSNAHLLLGRFRARVAARRAALEGVTRWRRGFAPRPKARFFPVDQEWAAARVAAFLPSADWRRLASACRALRAGLG